MEFETSNRTQCTEFPSFWRTEFRTGLIFWQALHQVAYTSTITGFPWRDVARGLAAFAGFKRESATGVSGSGARVAAIGTKAAPSRVMTKARCFKVRVESLPIHTGRALNRIQNRAELIQPILGAPFNEVKTQMKDDS